MNLPNKGDISVIVGKFNLSSSIPYSIRHAAVRTVLAFSYLVNLPPPLSRFVEPSANINKLLNMFTLKHLCILYITVVF